MTDLLHELILRSAATSPEATAVTFKAAQRSYAQLAAEIDGVARGLLALDTARLDRVAIYLPKTFECVAAIFGISRAGAVFVPVNPILKREQVGHILRDCNVRTLITNAGRLQDLASVLENCPDLRHVIVTDEPQAAAGKLPVLRWSDFVAATAALRPHRNIDTDVAAIFYTSGSTGKPKGVVLSQRNMVTGAESVSQYLENTPQDRLLAVLPFSFDYGFSQMSTAFRVGASVVLLDFLLPRDVVNAITRERITGLAGVPPLWAQLAELQWPATVTEHLRYITNSGGSMPRTTLAKLRAALPKTKPFLMYGLTEAFRSTFLPPEEVDRRPDSIGKAIPNAEILVVRPDGTECAANEEGELVHRGSLVALGYWNDVEKTAQRYKPVPGQNPGLVLTELAVWSGDTVRRDEEGFLYFVGRRDEMIKTSGYRVSPTEVEEVVLATGRVGEVAAIGVPHETLGQAIAIVVAAAPGVEPSSEKLLEACRAQLPLFMVPHHVEWRESLPRNPNGKYDRASLATELKAQLAQLLTAGTK
jgi:acyl-CoA ligase (AMP-forming) (exosortase A-associated)